MPTLGMNRRSLASGSNDTAPRMAHLPRVEESASAEGRGSEVWLAAQASTLTRRLQMASAPLLEVCGVQPPEHQDMRPEHSSDVEIDSGDRPRVRSSTSAIVLDSGDRPRAVELPLCQHSQDVELPWSCLELPGAAVELLGAAVEMASPPPGACCQAYRRDDGAGNSDSPTSREVQQRDSQGVRQG